ncbi:ATP-binding cassette domain-containing protein [Sporosarcina sp. CAU 1771]
MLHIKDVSIHSAEQKLVERSTFSVEAGKITTLIGESGSGKSLTLLAVTGMLPENMEVTGEILFQDKNLLKMSSEQLMQFRRTDVFFIFQDAFNSFNPSVRLGKQLFTLSEANSLIRYGAFIKKITPILMDLQLHPDILTKFPFELSGGMLQRSMIACALYRKPSLIIADEPTSGLDYKNQQELIALFKEMNRSLGTTILLVTHDIDVVKAVAHQVSVMLEGTVVESGSLESVLENPTHTYTKRLLESSFRLDGVME